jgi:hypothetical protein
MPSWQVQRHLGEQSNLHDLSCSEVAGQSICADCPHGGFYSEPGATSVRQTFQPYVCLRLDPSTSALSRCLLIRT